MSDLLRIVLVGCGGISHAWFNALKEIADVSIVGVVDLQTICADNIKSLAMVFAAIKSAQNARRVIMT